jgi:putative membrane protein
MKMAFSILWRDVKLLLRNPIALLVVGALLVLPGLYAWYCIIANWDPYANTGNMPIAVVNEDAGANSELTGEINIGKQVIDQLKENDSIDWHFYDSEEKALLDTRDGTCYAAIVFPETLSQDVIGIFSGSAAEPTLYYYPNQKYNAVATKVSDSAVQTLQR